MKLGWTGRDAPEDSDLEFAASVGDFNLLDKVWLFLGYFSVT